MTAISIFFLDGSNFMQNGIIIRMLLAMAFFLSHSPKGISFSSQSVNIGSVNIVRNQVG